MLSFSSYDQVPGQENDNDFDENIWDEASGNLESFEIGAIDDDDDENDYYDEESWNKRKRCQHDALSTTSASTLTSIHNNITSRIVRPPTSYYCPLTLHLMKDPVVDGCGHCFDRDAISAWLKFHSMCPISRKPLHTRDLVESTALKARIEEWRESHMDFNVDEQEFLRPSEQDSHSQLELMLLPQERRVLSIIKFRKRLRVKRERCSRCVWSAVFGVTVLCVAIAFTAIYVFDIEIRGSL